MPRRKRRFFWLVASVGLMVELGRFCFFAGNTFQLIVATAKGQDAEASRLVRSGVFVNGELQGRTSLDYAVLRGSPELVKLLLTAGANPDYRHGISPITSREIAARHRPDLMAIFDSRSEYR